MERDFEYTVIVRGNEYVSSSAKYGDGQKVTVPEQEIKLSSLHLDTIQVLQDWLSRWGVLSRVAAKYDSLCVPLTFEVLGQYLYLAIFPGPIAEGFDNAKAAAEKQKAPLRVVLRFEQKDNMINRLAAYAWEFLYHPADPSGGRDGFFIGAETNLTLSRLLPFRGQRPELPKGVLPLRVLFIVSTPDSLDSETAKSLEIQPRDDQSAEYRADRTTLINYLLELQTDASRLEVRFFASWDRDRISGALAEKAFNIIHVVGVCRSRSGSDDVEMALPGANGYPTWQSAQILVDVLKQAVQGGSLGLVVLHLCEVRPSDYTATFERLAPKLVQSGIPAVLAMQYPVPATKATSFIEQFYQLLTKGKEIGQAVQEARGSLLAESRDDRGFGTPALYLQSVDGQLLQAAASPRQSTVMSTGRSGPEKLAGKLRETVVRGGVELGTALDLSAWIDGIDWSADSRILTQQILAKMREDKDQTRHGPVYTEMIDIVTKSGA